MITREAIEVEVVGANLTRGTISYKSTGRKRESVRWRNPMQIDMNKKLKSENAEAYHMRDEHEGKYWGGKGKTLVACDHGLSRRSLRVKR